VKGMRCGSAIDCMERIRLFKIVIIV